MPKITLSPPVVWHTESVKEIEIKRPTAADYMEIGEIGTIVREGGAEVLVEDTGAIRAYARRCINHEAGDHILSLCSLEDGMRIRSEIIDFFAAARRAISGNSSTSSS